jgi:hypothetical protein
MSLIRPSAALFALLALCSASALAANISLRVSYSADHGKVSFTPVHAETGTFAVTPNARDGRDRAQWKVIARDARGKVRYQVAVPNTLERHVEVFNPRTRAIAQAFEMPETSGVFEVALPYDQSVASVDVVAQNAGGPATLAASAPVASFSRAALDAAVSRSRSQRAMLAAPASATTIISTGPAAARMDYVFIGDGYTAAEMDKWHADAKKVIDGFMADPLFAANRGAMNVRRVDVASNESGVDEPDKGIYKDTALDAYFYCGQVDRLICVNTAKVFDVVGSVLAPDARDVIIVISNSTRYGGSGGQVAALTMNAASIEVTLHEIGHTAFGLADEYDYGSCSLGAEPPEADVSRDGSRNVKWNRFIAAGTPVPTNPGVYANGTVGTFVGAQYCASGKYRPTENSRMRTLGYPWHVVNETAARSVFARYAGNGGVTQTGTLANGGVAYAPSASPGYVQAGAGTFTVQLSGPATADFDLYLYKWWNGAWTLVARSESPDASESISYNGSAGYYYAKVSSYSGSGAYSLTYSFPSN